MSETILRILTVSDVHGSLLDVNYANNLPTTWGLSRLASAIRQKRDPNTILVDSGDTIQGSPLLYFHQTHRHDFENPAATVYNELSFDYYVPGNHDFNYGQDYLLDFVHQLHATPLSANLLLSNGNPFLGKGFDVRVIDGIRIAFVGVTTDYIPNWERKEHIDNLTFLSPLDAIEKSIQALHKSYDALVVIYHGGFERDLHTKQQYVEDTLENVGSRILERFPEIDVLLTGHQHRTIAEIIGNTAVIQPASNGRMMGEVELRFAKSEEGVHLLDKKVSLIQAKDYPADPAFRILLSDIQESTNIFLDEPIGFVPEKDLKITDLFAARRDKHKIVTFINQVQLMASQAMISATSLGNDVTGFDETISIRNVLSTYVYPNTLTVVKIDGLRLKQALEKNAEYFLLQDGVLTSHPKFSYPKVEHYNYDMFDGIAYTIDVKRPIGERITSLRYAGKPVQEDQWVTLVLNNYRAAGGGEFEMYRGLEIVKEIPFDISELLIEHIRARKTIHVPNIENIHVLT